MRILHLVDELLFGSGRETALCALLLDAAADDDVDGGDVGDRINPGAGRWPGDGARRGARGFDHRSVFVSPDFPVRRTRISWAGVAGGAQCGSEWKQEDERGGGDEIGS